MSRSRLEDKVDLNPSLRPFLLKQLNEKLRQIVTRDGFEYRGVLVLYTGGTIGMTKNKDGVYVPKADYLSAEMRHNSVLHDAEYAQHLSNYVKPLGDVYALPIKFTESHLYGSKSTKKSESPPKRILYGIYEYPTLKDSSNISIKDWVDMADLIQHYYEKFDGFLIIHGTDTMAYTASALSFMFKNLGKPVILTGSQVPLEENRSDGTENLLGALYFAGHYVIPEVTLFFAKTLYRGNRVMKFVCNTFDAYDSPNFDPLGRMDVNVTVDKARLLQSESNEKFEVDKNMNGNVGILKLYPGITVQTVRSFLQPPMKGVVFQSYGVGNGPTDNDELLEEIKKATDRGVLILNCTQCVKGAVSITYATGEALQKAGLIPGEDIISEAALAKLGYVLGKPDLTMDDQVKMLQRNLRGEITLSDEEDE